MDDAKPANPGVRFPPPLVYVLPFFASFLLDRSLPFFIVGDGDAPVGLSVAGTALMIAGFGLMYWAIADFWRARTHLLPFKPATTLVTVPPYTFTRNPMYVGMTLAYLGAALATNWAWPLVFLPAVIGVMSAFVIAREERYLAVRFGADYDAYRARVRRWL